MNKGLCLDDQLLARAWIRGIPISSLTDSGVNELTFSRLNFVRNQLYLKSLRLKFDWSSIWLNKPPTSKESEKLTLHRLSILISEPDITPSYEDPLSYWVPPTILLKLKHLKLTTCQEFITFFATSEKFWWAGIDGLGEVHAKQVQEIFTNLFPESLIKAVAVIDRTPIVYETGVVPLERLLIPEHINGSMGVNRSETRPDIEINNDLSAIYAWLKRHDIQTHTYRSYKREAERLLLWSLTVKFKAISSLDHEDIKEYFKFIKSPKPIEKWVGRPRKQNDIRWRPFKGPLSHQSQKLAYTIIKGLFGFLVEVHYLKHNPFSVLPMFKKQTKEGAILVNRSFSEAQWHIIDSASNKLIDSSDKLATRKKWLRARMISFLGFSTGLRLHEIVQAKIEDVKYIERIDGIQTWITVLGKGQKIRKTPLPNSTYILIRQTYLLLTGLSFTSSSPDYPLIPSLRKSVEEHVMPLAIHTTIKGFFEQISLMVKEEHPDLAQKIDKASTHWLRHTYGSISAEKSVPLSMIKENMGHSSLETTSQYIHAEEDANHAQFNKIF
ncbi:site-specific integrase [Methylomonas sp. AM2-LC]|uniref:tyrosine-type recombinase/integrase n=1 Tax=Methylomonas sp. AM2-LC TaxID=3153301 RepID=UPI003262EDFE